LTKFGLKHYCVHRVQNSPWIAELEQQNAVHPAHNKVRFMESKVHYIFTFQDSMLECVAHEGKWWAPKVSTFDDPLVARQEWQKLIAQLTGDKEDF
jgi:3-methyladenine DNA glycosylase AlkD